MAYRPISSQSPVLEDLAQGLEQVGQGPTTELYLGSTYSVPFWPVCLLFPQISFLSSPGLHAFC